MIGLAATAAYLPEGWMSAADIAATSGIPEPVIVEKFGLRGKHVAGPAEGVTELSVRAAGRLIEEQDLDPAGIDAVIYFGSSWKEYPVWQAAPLIADRLGCRSAFVLELDYVSCGSPVALRVVRDVLEAEQELRTALLVGASCESHLLDYRNERARFMFNFGDGAVAALLVKDHPANPVLGAHMITDGSFSLDVKVPAGGSARRASHATVTNRLHFLDVEDPRDMKGRLDPVSLPNFVAVAEEAARRSGAGLEEVDFLCAIHMKRSMHRAVVGALGIDPDRSVYLDDTGHMSGVDPLLALDRAARAGRLEDEDLVLLLAAGTGYTWAAATVRWGPIA